MILGNDREYFPTVKKESMGDDPSLNTNAVHTKSPINSSDDLFPGQGTAENELATKTENMNNQTQRKAGVLDIRTTVENDLHRFLNSKSANTTPPLNSSLSDTNSKNFLKILKTIYNSKNGESLSLKQLMARARIFLDNEASVEEKAAGSHEKGSEQSNYDSLSSNMATLYSDIDPTSSNNTKNNVDLAQYEGKNLVKELPKIRTSSKLDNQDHVMQEPGAETMGNGIFLPEQTFEGDILLANKTEPRVNISLTSTSFEVPEEKSDKLSNGKEDTIMEVTSLLDEEERNEDLKEIIEEVYLNIKQDFNSPRILEIFKGSEIRESASDILELLDVAQVKIYEGRMPSTANELSGDITSSVFLDDFDDTDHFHYSNDLEYTNLRVNTTINEIMNPGNKMEAQDETSSTFGHAKQPRTLVDKVKLEQIPEETDHTVVVNQSIEVKNSHSKSSETGGPGETYVYTKIGVEIPGKGPGMDTSFPDEGQTLSIPDQDTEDNATAFEKHQENEIHAESQEINVADKVKDLNEDCKNNTRTEGVNPNNDDDEHDLTTFVWEDHLMDVMDVLYEDENEIVDFYKTELDGVRGYVDTDYWDHLTTSRPDGQQRKSFLKKG